MDAGPENSTDPDQKVTPEQGDGLGRGQALGGSQGELFAAQDREVTLANGYLCTQNSHSDGSINGQLENCGEAEFGDDQREGCNNPIYNLYAISVGVSAQEPPCCPRARSS